MDISVFGAGYVGSVAAACLARDGHNVIAVDLVEHKVDAINRGTSPIIEPGLEALIKRSVKDGRLRATTSTAEAIAKTDLSFICVGTPARANGSLDITHIVRVSEMIGAQLAIKNDFHSVVMRSTALPGTTESIVIPKLNETSGKCAGVDFGIAYYPEFLREGTAIVDYDEPGAVVFGVHDQKTLNRLLGIHAHLRIKPHTISIRASEAVKYVNNAWHALKISFANEVGVISKAMGVDGQDVMDVLCDDRKLNISTAYLTPGFAFGGSCLPKDLRALRYAARSVDLETPVLDATLKANENQLDHACQLIENAGKRRIGIVGLSFKPETDDLRYSPFVALAERLIGRGYRVRVYDPIVRLSRLTGTNRDYLSQHLPHIAEILLENPQELIVHSEVIVIGNRREAVTFVQELMDGSKIIVDLARIERHKRTGNGYHGICW